MSCVPGNLKEKAISSTQPATARLTEAKKIQGLSFHKKLVRIDQKKASQVWLSAWTSSPSIPIL